MADYSPLWLLGSTVLGGVLVYATNRATVNSQRESERLARAEVRRDRANERLREDLVVLQDSIGAMLHLVGSMAADAIFAESNRFPERVLSFLELHLRCRGILIRTGDAEMERRYGDFKAACDDLNDLLREREGRTTKEDMEEVNRTSYTLQERIAELMRGGEASVPDTP